MTGTTTSETDWAHLFDYPPHVSQHATAVSSAVGSTVVVATSPALSAAAAGTSTGTGIGIGIGTSSSANRRAGKPARRRSRASRKAPTTLFNTDTNNFRAMVQQFTGFPSGQGRGHPPPQPPPMTFLHQFNQHHNPPPLPQQEVVGTAPFGVSVQQQPQVYFHQQHLFGLGSSNTANPFLSGFGSGSSSNNRNRNHNNNDSNNNNNNNNGDDVNNQNLRSNMEYYSFDQFDRTNGRF